jgi:hypothetical protein
MHKKPYPESNEYRISIKNPSHNHVSFSIALRQAFNVACEQSCEKTLY